MTRIACERQKVLEALLFSSTRQRPVGEGMGGRVVMVREKDMFGHDALTLTE